MTARRTLAAVALLAIAIGCDPPGPEAGHTVLGTELESLRSAFNADAGHVRVVMLASPT